mgnify:CR=1 FL=1
MNEWMDNGKKTLRNKTKKLIHFLFSVISTFFNDDDDQNNDFWLWQR